MPAIKLLGFRMLSATRSISRFQDRPRTTAAVERLAPIGLPEHLVSPEPDIRFGTALLQRSQDDCFFGIG
jgi:hypothetical protein